MSGQYDYNQDMEMEKACCETTASATWLAGYILTHCPMENSEDEK